MMLRFAKPLGLYALAAMAAPALAAPAAKPPSFAMCGVCHKVNPGERSPLGPNLFGVAARKAGTLPDFSYSPAMKKASFAWTRDQLVAFITDPRKTVPGTRMVYAGQKNPQAAAAIADYLLSLK